MRAVWTLVNVVLRDEPRLCTTAMIAIEMPAAIRPYSIAVAPDSFARKFLNALMRRKSSSALRPQAWIQSGTLDSITRPGKLFSNLRQTYKALQDAPPDREVKAHLDADELQATP